jgi:hypothetical protein
MAKALRAARVRADHATDAAPLRRRREKGEEASSLPRNPIDDPRDRAGAGADPAGVALEELDPIEASTELQDDVGTEVTSRHSGSPAARNEADPILPGPGEGPRQALVV